MVIAVPGSGILVEFSGSGILWLDFLVQGSWLDFGMQKEF